MLICVVDVGVQHFAFTVLRVPHELHRIYTDPHRALPVPFRQLKGQSKETWTMYDTELCAPRWLKPEHVVSTCTTNIAKQVHCRVSWSECALNHTAEFVDRIAHLIQEHPIFHECDRLVVERQPISGLIAITNLLQREFAHKMVLVHPRSVQSYFGIGGRDEDERKQFATLMAVHYIPESLDPDLHRVHAYIVEQQQLRADEPGWNGVVVIAPELPRVHDRADTVLLAIYDLYKNLLPEWIALWRTWQLECVRSRPAIIVSRFFTAEKRKPTQIEEDTDPEYKWLMQYAHVVKRAKPCLTVE